MKLQDVLTPTWQTRRHRVCHQDRINTFYKEIQLASTQVDEAREVEWILDGVIPSGAMLILAGPGKRAGKSQFALGLCKAIARGTPFLGRATVQGSAFYCNLEDGLPRTARRLKQHGISTADDDMPFWVLHTMEQLHTALAVMARGVPRLLIVDPLAELELECGIKDENDSTQITQFFKPFRSLVQETGTTIIVVHHFNKTRAVMRGSSALEAASDGWLEYAPLSRSKKSDTRRRLSWVLRDAPADDMLVDVMIPTTYNKSIEFSEITGDQRKEIEREERSRMAKKANGTNGKIPSFINNPHGAAINFGDDMKSCMEPQDPVEVLRNKISELLKEARIPVSEHVLARKLSTSGYEIHERLLELKGDNLVARGGLRKSWQWIGSNGHGNGHGNSNIIGAH